LYCDANHDDGGDAFKEMIMAMMMTVIVAVALILIPQQTMKTVTTTKAPPIMVGIQDSTVVSRGQSDNSTRPVK